MKACLRIFLLVIVLWTVGSLPEVQADSAPIKIPTYAKASMFTMSIQDAWLVQELTGMPVVTVASPTCWLGVLELAEDECFKDLGWHLPNEKVKGPYLLGLFYETDGVTFSSARFMVMETSYTWNHEVDDADRRDFFWQGNWVAPRETQYIYPVLVWSITPEVFEVFKNAGLLCDYQDWYTVYGF